MTRIEPQRKDPTRVSVYLDGTFAFGAYAEVVEAAGIRPGAQMTAEATRELLEAEEQKRVYQRALHFIAHRPRTEAEVRERMGKQAVHPDVADDVLRRLTEQGYIDDKKYVEHYVSTRLGGKGYGPSRVRRELLRRGADEAVVAAALETFLAEANTSDLALEQARRRWPRLRSESDPLRRRKKLYDFLLRRGFTYQTAREAVERVADEDRHS